MTTSSSSTRPLRSVRRAVAVAAWCAAIVHWGSAASAVDTTIVISDDRTFTTLSAGVSPLTVAVVDNNQPNLVLGPVPTVVVDEAGLLDLTITATSASGGLTVTGTGLPAGATLYPNYGGPGKARWVWYPGYTDAGLHTGTITATDAAGHVVTVAITMQVRNMWGDGETCFLKPVAVPVQAAPVPIVRGSTAFTLIAENRYGAPMPPTGVTYQYLLDGQPIGAPAIGIVDTVLDVSTIPDGTHALSLELIDGPDLDRYDRLPILIIVDNVPGPVSGVQRVPLVGLTGFEGHYDPPMADWVTFPGVRSHPLAHPLAYRQSDPATTMGDPRDLLDAHNWLAEPLNQPIAGLHWGTATFYRNGRGDIYSTPFIAQTSSTSEGTFDAAERHDDYDGPRDDNSVSPYSTFVADPAGPGWVCVELSGAVRRVALDGSVTTLVGYQRRTDVTPYDFRDATIPIAAVHADTERLIGTFAGGIAFTMPVDLAFDPRDASHRTLYIADTGNHRIARIDLSGATPVITTAAGTPRVSGYRDGASGQALFSSPYSIAFAPDGSLYIADMGNATIRKLSPDGASVTTVAGGTLAPPVASKALVEGHPDDYIADGTIAQATVNYPQVLRLDSHNDIVFAEHLTGTVRRVNFGNGRIEKIGVLASRDPGWLWLDVDRHGNVGPRDDVMVTMGTGGGGNTEVSRLSADGTRNTRLFMSGGGSPYHTGQVFSLPESAGHYPWAIAIDDTESRMITTGFGTSGLVSFRRFLTGDLPFTYDYGTNNRGTGIWRTGTVANFPFGSRPGFTALRGATGHARLGDLANVDELGYWSDAQLAAYIQSGMGGSVPRPEITGNDLSALLYYIRRLSIRGNIEAIPVPVLDADRTPPVIQGIQVAQVDASTVRVQWQTDEATIGVVTWGLSDQYHGCSDIESGYGTSHSVLLRRLPGGKPIHYAIRSKDVAGNQTATADSTIVLDPMAVGGGAATTIANVAIGAIGTTTATISWDTGAPSTSQVIFGFNTGYGQQTTVDTTLVSHHVVTLTNLAPATTYHYRTVSSNRVIGVVDSQAPSAPTGLAVIAATASSLTLSWTAASDDVGVSGYRLDIATDAVFTAKVAGYDGVDLGNTTTRSVGGLAPGTTYYARVRAYDAGPNLSAWSAPAHGATAATGGTTTGTTTSGGTTTG
nr:fibronectin type III domain-containing protein [Planctomycetota bacterium]